MLAQITQTTSCSPTALSRLGARLALLEQPITRIINPDTPGPKSELLTNDAGVLFELSEIAKREVVHGIQPSELIVLEFHSREVPRNL